MGEIKSALEIALEKTKSVAGDKRAVEADRARKEGKQLVSRFFDDPSFNLEGSLKSYDADRVEWMKEGIRQVLMANLALPADQLAMKKIRRVGEGFKALSRKPKQVQGLFSQLESFFAEYIEEKERMREALVNQYTPRLKQKEQELSQKMGSPVRIDIDSDPEFSALLRKYMGQLEEKYQSVLDQAKEQLTEIV